MGRVRNPADITGHAATGAAHHARYTDEEAAAAGGGFTMHAIPGGLSIGSGDAVLFTSMFKDTTGNPDRCVIVTVKSTTQVAIVEYKRIGDAWVFDPADCAFDTTVTLNFTISSQSYTTAFSIDNPAATGDRVVFIAGNENLAPDEFEIDSIVLTPGSSSLTAVAVVIAGANEPAATNGLGTCNIPLSITRCMTFFFDDAHFADITEAAGVYTFTYDDAKVLAVDTSISVVTGNSKQYSGVVIGSQVLLLRSSGINLTTDMAWEMSIAAVLTEEFNPFRTGGMGTNQAVSTLTPAVLTAIGGSFAVAAPFGGTGTSSSVASYLVSPVPLDDI